MVFLKSLIVNMSPQVSRTFLRFQSDLNSTVVWMVSACPPIFCSFNHLTKPLGNLFKYTYYDWYQQKSYVTWMWPFTLCSFFVAWHGLSIYHCFRFLWFSLGGQLWRPSPLFSRFSFCFFFFFLKLSLCLVF